MSILIKHVSIEGGPEKDIFINRNRIEKIGTGLTMAADRVIDATGKAAIPSFVNGHTHAAMTLFRGYGDDMPLMKWLQECIWPAEAKLTEEDLYWGNKLACLEMIKSGTTTFIDMYFKFHTIASVVEEMGLRAIVCGVCFDHFNNELREKCKQENRQLLEESLRYGDRIHFALGPHAIYTVSGELLQWIHDFAAEHDLPVHLHLSETEEEVRNCVEKYGCTPVRYLQSLGVLSPRLILAHGVHMDEEEIRMLGDSGVSVVHNPASNMKLASGWQFRYKEMLQAGVKVGLGTDGCASSNNLDMVEAMKLAALMGKVWRMDPEAVPAEDIYRSATTTGAEIAGWDTGRIEEGRIADLCLVDLKIPAFTPNHHFISNLVYSANGSCIDTVICDGRILMENRRVPGEEEILEKSAELAYNLVRRT